MRFLVVEDEFVARLLLQRFLEPHGQVEMAADGLEAVAAVERALAEGRPYELITLDVLLPHLNGRTALRRIREAEAAAGVLPGRGARVVMATGEDDPRSVMEAFREQCDGFLPKPVEPHKLQALLLEFGLLTGAAVTRRPVPWKATRARLGLAVARAPLDDEPLFA